MGSADLAGWKRLGGNGRSLFRRRVSRTAGSARGNNRNALLENVAHDQGGQRRQAGARSAGSRCNIRSAGALALLGGLSRGRAGAEYEVPARSSREFGGAGS